jgi:hypothetical protein
VTLRLAIGLGLPLVTGWLVVHALAPGRGAARDRVLEAALGAALGLGLASVAFFLAVVAVGPGRPAALGADGALLAGALALTARRRARPAAPGAPAPGRAPLGLRAAGVIAAAGAVVAFALVARAWPHGEWDAWSVWNLKARFLAAPGDAWRAGFSPLLIWSHPDYPLLVPGLVARAWLYAGRETPTAPVLLAGLFAATTVALAGGALAVLRSEAQGWLGALVLAATPALTVHAALQYADVPLGCFALATVVCLALADRAAAERGPLLAAAGVALGCAAWTKNEGLLFAAAVVSSRLAVQVSRAGWRGGATDLGRLAVAVAPVLLALAYFKLAIAPPSPYLTQDAARLGGRLADPSRYLQVARAFGERVWGFGGWPVSVAAVLAVYAACLGRARQPAEWRGAAGAVAAVVLTGAAYLAAYVATPFPLEWQLGTSLGRLLLQLWPATVFTFFLVVSAPDGAWAGRPSPEKGRP